MVSYGSNFMAYLQGKSLEFCMLFLLVQQEFIAYFSFGFFAE
jgi:hypothetical protein